MEVDAKIATDANQGVLREIDTCPEPLFQGGAAQDRDMEERMWRAINARDVTFFNWPLLNQVRHRPYHEATLTGSFDMGKLLQHHRNDLYRSEAAYDDPAKPSVQRLLLRLPKDVFVVYEDDHLRVFAPTPQTAAKTAAQFRQYLLPSKRVEVGFHLVSVDPDGPRSKWVGLAERRANTTEDLKLHYGDDFIAWEEGWLQRVSKRHSGVTILFGPPGCGKTSYVRSLMSRFMESFVFYYLPVSSFELLSSPHLVGFWLQENQQYEGKHKLAILEDAEDLLLARDECSRAKVSNLLNIGDGFLGEHLRLQVIATTNVPRQRLDEALLRPGRLMGTREFRRLSRAEARRLAQAKGLELLDQQDYSLAEIYNGAAEVTGLDARKPMGFA